MAGAVAFATLGGCAPTERSAAPAPPAPTDDQKLAWILRLEDVRMLREPAGSPLPVAPAARPGAAPPGPPPAPDLLRLLEDPDARVRRRAALAVGRIRLAEGVPALVRLLDDPEAEVRQMAAFALGLVGDRSAGAGLLRALTDPAPLVQGRAAEALGRLGDAAAAPAIGHLVGSLVRQGVLGAIDPDDERYPLGPEVEAVRLGVYALGGLEAYDALAAALLGRDGRPMSRWWPVAYAFSRLKERRALPVLLDLLQGPGRYTVAFAAQGLARLGDPAARQPLARLLDPERHGPGVVVAAIRALAVLGGEAPPELAALLARADLDPNLRLETVVALGTLRARVAVPLVMNLIAHPWPSMRAAALGALAAMDRESFVPVVSSLGPDPHWSVRAALASALAQLDLATARPRLEALLADEDKRVVPSALRSLLALDAPDAARRALAMLEDSDPVVRLAAARAVGEVRPPSGVAALTRAYELGLAEGTYGARAGALEALTRYGGEVAAPVLRAALADRDWAVRVRAASLLAGLGPGFAPPPEPFRPAPGAPPPGVERYDAPELLNPPYSPHVYIETDKGTIEIELAIMDAPLSVRAFMALVRRGFFDGLTFHRVVPGFVVQAGDPRGDGEGGPGFTLRDEVSERLYLRGTVGLALDWADTAGSQFFIACAPQPHLDGRYTVIGQVVAGLDVIDRLQQWDVMRRVRVWDGVSMGGS